MACCTCCCFRASLFHAFKCSWPFPVPWADLNERNHLLSGRYLLPCASSWAVQGANALGGNSCSPTNPTHSSLLLFLLFPPPTSPPDTLYYTSNCIISSYFPCCYVHLYYFLSFLVTRETKETVILFPIFPDTRSIPSPNQPVCTSITAALTDLSPTISH